MGSAASTKLSDNVKGASVSRAYLPAEAEGLQYPLNLGNIPEIILGFLV